MTRSTRLSTAAAALLALSFVGTQSLPSLAHEVARPTALATAWAPPAEEVAGPARGLPQGGGAVDFSTMQIWPEWLAAVVDWLVREQGLPAIYDWPNVVWSRTVCYRECAAANRQGMGL